MPFWKTLMTRTILLNFQRLRGKPINTNFAHSLGNFNDKSTLNLQKKLPVAKNHKAASVS